MPERVLRVQSADGTTYFEQHIAPDDAVFIRSEPLQVIEANPRNRIERQEIGEAVICQIGGTPEAVSVPEAPPAPEEPEAPKPKRVRKVATKKSTTKKSSAKKSAKKSSAKAKS